MYAHAAAPCRIGIAGGGTDLPVWTRERTGLCLSLAIKMYTHSVAIHRPDKMVVAAYRNRDTSSAATEIANGLIRESALLHGWEDSFEVHTLSELSSHGSGLGVSSSIAVALAACFSRLARLRDGDQHGAMTGAAADPRWYDGGLDGFKQQVAKDAWTVEIDKLRRPIGRQDHVAAAHGGLRLYSFEGENAQIERSFSNDDAVWVAKHLMLVRLPEGHDSRAILSGVTQLDMLAAAFEAVPLAVEAVEKRDVAMLGKALDRGQASKNKIPGAAPPWLDKILAQVDACTTFGCKVAGAGGGGHLVVACEPGARESLSRATLLPVITIEPDLTGVRSEGWT